MRALVFVFVFVLLGLVACESSDVSRAVGARCDDDTECDERCLEPHPDWPGGFCTLSCDANDGCPADAACIADEGGVCAFRCALDGDCAFLGSGWTCQTRTGKPDGTEMVCRGG